PARLTMNRTQLVRAPGVVPHLVDAPDPIRHSDSGVKRPHRQSRYGLRIGIASDASALLTRPASALRARRARPRRSVTGGTAARAHGTPRCPPSSRTGT